MSEARRLATYADLVGLPEHLTGEILDGEVVVSPRPAGPHSRVGAGMTGTLFGPFDRRPGGPEGPGGWWILFVPELHLSGHVLVPDLAGWRREHLPRGPVDVAFTVAPDWICEILSPQSARRDRVQKMDVYHRVGVEWAWLVDPDARTLEVYRRHDGGWVRLAAFADDARVRAEPFDAIELDLATLWAR